jgi:hypothetical protein
MDRPSLVEAAARPTPPVGANPDSETGMGARPLPAIASAKEGPRAPFSAPSRKTSCELKPPPPVRGSVRPNCWPRGRAQRRPGRVCSPTSEFGFKGWIGLYSVPDLLRHKSKYRVIWSSFPQSPPRCVSGGDGHFVSLFKGLTGFDSAGPAWTGLCNLFSSQPACSN